jgi:hypothetical protein
MTNAKILECAILRAEKYHGSLRAAAKALHIDGAYLYRIKKGLKRNPSDSVLGKLGVRKKVTYELI